MAADAVRTVVVETDERPAGPDEVEALRARVAALEADLQELAYVASHDLTEPLRMVTSYLGLVERRCGDQLDATAREFMAYAVDGAARMRRLLDDLLRYSRAGGEEPERVPVPLDGVLEGVVRALGPALQEEGATVHVDGALPVVHADAVQLGQLLQNLVANAAKFHPPDRGCTVRVGAHRNEAARAWELWVADDGIGIEPRQQDRIFLIFQRLNGREEYAGTGIGLAICRRIVERFGGAIAVASSPGAGATFTVTIPDPPAAPR